MTYSTYDCNQNVIDLDSVVSMTVYIIHYLRKVKNITYLFLLLIGSLMHSHGMIYRSTWTKAMKRHRLSNGENKTFLKIQKQYVNQEIYGWKKIKT
jgi:hypothetical protein